MKALTIWQPWATLIALGRKRIETRPRPYRYRGWLAVHAALRWEDDQKALCQEEPFKSALEGAGELPLGSIVAVAFLAGCDSTESLAEEILEGGSFWSEDELDFGDFTEGRAGLVLEPSRQIVPPYPIRGHQGLWTVPEDVVAVLRERQRPQPPLRLRPLKVRGR